MVRAAFEFETFCIPCEQKSGLKFFLEGQILILWMLTKQRRWLIESRWCCECTKIEGIRGNEKENLLSRKIYAGWKGPQASSGFPGRRFPALLLIAPSLLWKRSPGGLLFDETIRRFSERQRRTKLPPTRQYPATILEGHPLNTPQRSFPITGVEFVFAGRGKEETSERRKYVIVWFIACFDTFMNCWEICLLQFILKVLLSCAICNYRNIFWIKCF